MSDKTLKILIDKLQKEKDLLDAEFHTLIEGLRVDMDKDLSIKPTGNVGYLFSKARGARDAVYGNFVYLRGLIEFTNICKNNCLYCGIRAGNEKAERYRLSKDEILSCVDNGYSLGFRTFVLQGGEDMFFSDDMICDIVSDIKRKHPDCAVTLSIGEKERESYEAYFKAGTDRYLLRHESANEKHYGMLHPKEMSIEHRKKCLFDLKDIGYQVGAGIMVGSPYQTLDNIIEDLRFMKELKPQMVGIGPFIAHKDTPFCDKESGTLEDALILLAIIRLMLPDVLLPATTALGTIHPLGREYGLLAGANVIMPNLSPGNVRKKYLLYDGKICTGDEAAECVECTKRRIESAGCKVDMGRGDFKRLTFQESL